MESLTDTLHLDEPTSVSIPKKFQENFIAAKNYKTFSVVIDHFIPMKWSENGAYLIFSVHIIYYYNNLTSTGIDRQIL